MSRYNTMGIGALGTPNVTFRTKVRWSFEATFPSTTLPLSIVRTKRPQLTVEEIEQPDGTHHVTTSKWDLLETSYYDPITVSLKDGESGVGVLRLLDHTAEPMEIWELDGLRLVRKDENTLTWSYDTAKYTNVT